MPIFTIIGLVLSLIKIAMDIARYLQDHPNATQDLKAAASRAVFTLDEVHKEMSEWEKSHDPESA